MMSETTPSPQKIFLWNILGSLSTAAISVLLLLVVSRTLTDFEADIFSIAYAIGNLFVVIGLFQVRNFQSTDMQPKYTFNEYFVARLLSCLGMAIAVCIYIWIKGYEGYKAVIILIICLYRLTDALSDVFQGLFQQKQRLDIASKSLVYRNAMIFLSFTLVTYMTRNLILSLVIVCIVSITCILSFDLLKIRFFETICIKGQSLSRVKDLLQENIPLFLNGFLLVYIYNQPKYSLDKLLETGQVAEGSQKLFNILFMPVFVLNLTMLFLRPLITEMALHYSKRNMIAYNSLKNRIFAVLGIFSIFILVMSYFLGIPVLGFVYGTKLQAYQQAFMILMIGGVFSSFSSVFDNIITVLRKQHWLVLAHIFAFVVSALISDSLVSIYGILGASYSFLLSMISWLLSLIAIYIFITRKEQMSE
ncbi:lipopolysaccharide biosynthesis protein [Streptococcus pneumoniae]